MRVAIALDRRSAAPLHRQIYDAWRRGILDGRFRSGERVPSTRELAAALRVSRTTVSTAYEQLGAEGYFDASHGSGTYVCHQLPQQPVRAPRPSATRPVRPLKLSVYARRLETDRSEPPATSGVLDLSNLGPDLDAFPFPLWRRLMLRHLRHATPDVFDYTASATGLEALRREIAVYLARSRAVRCTPDQVLIVNGSQQALDFCARLFVDPGDEVAVENPGYPRARQLFAAHGAVIRPVAVTADGLDLAALPPAARVVYVTPSHQFPSGVSMSLSRRLELVEWARARSAVVVEDDYDSEYRYDGAPLPALQGLRDDAPVVYMGTFSKVMFPGLRLGYLVVPRELILAFTRAKVLSDRQSSGLEQVALADFLREGHLERHIRRMRRLYQRRRDVLIDALARQCGSRVTIYGDAAGMHLVARIAGGAAAVRASGGRLRLETSARFYVSNPPPDEFILGFSAIGERAIRNAVKLL